MEEEPANAVILVSQHILQLRGQSIIFDKDLAGLYGVTTKTFGGSPYTIGYAACRTARRTSAVSEASTNIDVGYR